MNVVSFLAEVWTFLGDRSFLAIINDFRTIINQNKGDSTKDYIQILFYRVARSTEFSLVRKVNKINELLTDTLFH